VQNYILHIDLVCRYFSDFLDFVVKNSKSGVTIYNHSIPNLRTVRRGLQKLMLCMLFSVLTPVTPPTSGSALRALLKMRKLTPPVYPTMDI